MFVYEEKSGLGTGVVVNWAVLLTKNNKMSR